VIAIPNPHFPPSADALTLADIRLEHLDALTPEVLRDLEGSAPRPPRTRRRA